MNYIWHPFVFAQCLLFFVKIMQKATLKANVSQWICFRKKYSEEFKFVLIANEVSGIYLRPTLCKTFMLKRAVGFVTGPDRQCVIN